MFIAYPGDQTYCMWETIIWHRYLKPYDNTSKLLKMGVNIPFHENKGVL